MTMTLKVFPNGAVEVLDGSLTFARYASVEEARGDLPDLIASAQRVYNRAVERASNAQSFLESLEAVLPKLDEV